MCVVVAPAVAMGVSMAMTAASTAVAMYGQHQSQKAQEKSAKAAAAYNAQVAENEAAVQQGLARNEIAKGVADRERQQRQAARAMGEMRAGMGASGFEMDSGTSLYLLAESAAEHQYDSAVLASNAEQAAWQNQMSALSATNQKGLADWQYANAGSGRNAALIGMGGTLLGGIGAGINQYSDWQSARPNGAGGGGAPYNYSNARLIPGREKIAGTGRSGLQGGSR